MSTHIGAAPGDIAPLVLLPGDPLRARWIAETFLEDARCYFEGLDYAPVADFGLLRAAHDAAETHAGGAGVHVGLVFSSDSFYPARPERTFGAMVEIALRAGTA